MTDRVAGRLGSGYGATRTASTTVRPAALRHLHAAVPRWARSSLPGEGSPAAWVLGSSLGRPPGSCGAGDAPSMSRPRVALTALAPAVARPPLAGDTGEGDPTAVSARSVRSVRGSVSQSGRVEPLAFRRGRRHAAQSSWIARSSSSLRVRGAGIGRAAADGVRRARASGAVTGPKSGGEMRRRDTAS